jgi:hypothetical protein
VAKFLSDNQIQNQFHLPLSVQAFQEYQALQDLIQGIQVQLGGKDTWTYIWEMQDTPRVNFIISHIGMYNLHNILSGFGTPNVPTKSEFLHGCYSWID